MTNKFDFNKLFDKGINFGRYSQSEYLKDLCRQKIQKNFESVRSYSILSKTHQEQLVKLIEEIKEFVYDPNTSDTLTFNIESYALKKALSRRVTEIYMNTGIFTEFTRQSPETIIKKSKQFKQAHFLKDLSGSSDQSSIYYSSSKSSYTMMQNVAHNIDSIGLSGKTTCNTISNEPVFGFCEEEPK